MANHCRHCGAALPRPGVRFCPSCGGQIGAGAGPPTVKGLPYQAPAAATLLIQEPGQAAYSVSLHQPLMTMGRDPGNDIVIANSAVSRQQGRIELRGQEHWIVDLGSTNGTAVNGKRIQNHKLNHNDIIRIGDQRGNSVGLTFASAAAAAQPLAALHLGQMNLGQQPVHNIGRDPSNHIHLDHASVSRFHARLEQTQQGHAIRDLGSANGTFVNGHGLRGAHALQNGDVILVGPFKLIYDQAGLTQFTPGGNYRLDGLQLRRQVLVGGRLPWMRWAGIGQPSTPKLILNDVSLCIYPREFVALVGGSGAGKTTLMNALSGFVPAEGAVLINGDHLYANFAAYRSVLGYVPQDDIIHSQLTVYSALHYAARLRLPDAAPAEIEQRLKQALALVEMKEHAAKPVNRLSGGQRKRVSIAVELLAEPGLFFLDEPTSGLDPGLEKKMMYTMRQLADAGRTIILVTHATANITQCTHVAFMADGHMAYFGPPPDALAFFGATDFADIYSRLSQPLDAAANPPPPGWQPAAAGAPATAAEAWAACYRASPDFSKYVAGRLPAGGAPPAAGAGAASRPARQRVSLWQQYLVLGRRYFELIRRDVMSLFVLLMVMPIIGLLLVVMSAPHDLVGKSPSEVQRQMQQAIGEQRRWQDPRTPDERFQATYAVAGAAQKLLFMLALAANLLGMFAAAYEIIEEEAIYRRERMVNLEIAPYLASKFTVLAGFALVQCLTLLAIVRLRVRFPQQGVLLPAALEMYLTLFLAALAGIALGLLVSALVRSSGAVIYIVLLILFVQIMFAGAIFELPTGAKPVSYLTATRWTLEALGGTVDVERLKGTEVTCIEFEDERTAAMLGAAQAPCERGQMHQAASYDFNVSYRHSAGHLLSRWAVLAGFSTILLYLTWIVQRRKDLV